MDDKSSLPIGTVGEVRGFFDIFLPGLFLLVHLVPLVYCLPKIQSAQHVLSRLADNPAKAAVFGVPAAYLLGLALRLARTYRADWAAGKIFRLTSGRAMLSEVKKWYETPEAEEYVKPQLNWQSVQSEGFPYPALMLARVATSTPEALNFYVDTWSNRRAYCSLMRFNFLKTTVASIDRDAAKELYVAEVLIRHAASMCYALFFSVLSLGACAVLSLVSGNGFSGILLCLCIGEAFVLGVVLPNLRSLRVAEVELVFTWCFIKQVDVERLVNTLQKGNLFSM